MTPRAARGHTRRFTIAGAEGHLITSAADNGSLGHVVVHLGKHGSTLHGMTDALSKMINLGLTHNVPLAEIAADLIGMAYEPRGLTNDPDIRIAQSITDYVGRRLALDYLPYAERAPLGLLTR
ncbi:TSCPD domain-containing protein [Sphaerisporangium fuscum]|uniref:TSCPD domain-containing protein n=1 Tax=Sphaerisporangium fuscum TaxID=2835868 RepID=UPI001BDD237D|nr:hypothetical protein [Sphaerisporangium fuscum]